MTFVSGDAAGVAKALKDAAKTNPFLIIKGGSIAGKTMSASDIEALADLPSRDVLLAVLGVDQGYAVQALLAMREGGPIRSLLPVQRVVEPRLQDVIGRYLDVRSLFFRIDAEAGQADQSAHIRAIARRGDDGALGIVQWIFR